jgi:hypothetical protein
MYIRYKSAEKRLDQVKFECQSKSSRSTSRLVLTAIICFATASGPREETIHSLRVRAFNIVSAVVKVFETTTTSVVSGSKSLMLRATSTGSTFARLQDNQNYI